MNRVKAASVFTKEPTAIFTPFGGRVEIRMYGKETGDWHLKQLDDAKHSADLRERIICVAEDTGLRNIYAPRPKVFNTKIATLSECRAQETLCGYTSIGLRTRVMLYHGAVAEALEVFPMWQHRQPIGAYFSTADCAVVILHRPFWGWTMAAHAGRDSLVDRELILNKKPGRKHFSIIDAVVEESGPRNREELRAFICGATSAHVHSLEKSSQYAEYNWKLVRYLESTFPSAQSVQGDELYLSITNLIKEQLIGHGVRPENIGTDSCDPLTDLSKNHHHLWWSHGRWLREGQKGPDGRNAILVIRKW